MYEIHILKKSVQIAKFSIDVTSYAKEGIPVDNLRCVGCGHCVDVCPTKTLKYSTNFMRYLQNCPHH